MPEMDDLIASLRERIRSRNAFENNSEEKVYSDEKIIFTADHLRSFRPPELREMRRIAQSKDSIRWSESRLFYEQARFMAEFEDDKPYSGSFELYFPTYQRLNEDQLRGYFTWRTGMRRGRFDDSSTTYCFIYIYEILHNIGVASPEEGAGILNRIWAETEKHTVRSWIGEWASDYCAYYGVSAELFDVLKPQIALESALKKISDCDDIPDGELYGVMCGFVPGYAERSVLVKEHLQDHLELSCRILRKIAERYRKKSEKEYADSLYMIRNSVSKNMFRNAVFFDYKAPRMYTCTVSDFSEYRCRGTNWSWSGLGRQKDNNDLRMIFHEADNLLREHYGYTSLLKDSGWTKEKKKLASKALQEMLEERRQAERRKVVFDMSILDDIRKSSEIMKEKLIVPGSEEEFRESDAAETAVPAEEPEAAAAAVMEEEERISILDEEERELLQAILSGDPGKIGKFGFRLSLLCDSVNEKLYELIGDTAIEFDGDTPVIVDDYLEEVKGALA
ncbi:MAG: TerB N-terminal domain-containing protein [Oscillospiraceae bacterium]|nr:TerB N-terminal domain-containing protein [Oscillospiraceae bacterium]